MFRSDNKRPAADGAASLYINRWSILTTLIYCSMRCDWCNDMTANLYIDVKHCFIGPFLQITHFNAAQSRGHLILINKIWSLSADRRRYKTLPSFADSCLLAFLHFTLPLFHCYVWYCRNNNYNNIVISWKKMKRNEKKSERNVMVRKTQMFSIWGKVTCCSLSACLP